MASVSPAASGPTDIESRTFLHWNLPNGDTTDWVLLKSAMCVMVVSDRALTAEIVGDNAALINGFPAIDGYTNPDGTNVGIYYWPLPPAMRMKNASGAAAEVTMFLLPKP